MIARMLKCTAGAALCGVIAVSSLEAVAQTSAPLVVSEQENDVQPPEQCTGEYEAPEDPVFHTYASRVFNEVNAALRRSPGPIRQASLATFRLTVSEAGLLQAAIDKASTDPMRDAHLTAFLDGFQISEPPPPGLPPLCLPINSGFAPQIQPAPEG